MPSRCLIQVNVTISESAYSLQHHPGFLYSSDDSFLTFCTCVSRQLSKVPIQKQPGMQALSRVLTVFDTLTGIIPTANNDDTNVTASQICHFRHSVDAQLWYFVFILAGVSQLILWHCHELVVAQHVWKINIAC